MAKLTATHITIIFCTVVAGIVALSIFDKDDAALTAILLAIATALGVNTAQNNEIKQNVNGRIDRILAANEHMAHRAIDAAAAAPSNVVQMQPAAPVAAAIVVTPDDRAAA